MRIVLFLFVLLFTISDLYAQSEKEQVAVLELDVDGLSLSEAATLTNRLRSELVKTDSFTIVERSKMNEILDEQGFQMTGCTSSECAVEAGKILSVNRICTGNVGRLGSMYTLTIRLIDVESGKILKSVTEDCLCPIEEVLTKAIPRVAAKLSGVKRYDQKIGGSGDLLVKSEPAGAKIFIDSLDTKNVTPFLIKNIAAGIHLLQLEKGELSASENVIVKSNELTQRELRLTKDSTGGLSINSEPQGADIYIDGKKFGKTPKTIVNLPYGQYRVVLKKEPYFIYEKIVNITDRQFIPVEGILMKNATLILSPSAQNDIYIKVANIYINGANAGQLYTKRVFKLYPGQIEIVIKNEGYIDWKKEVFIGEGEEKEINVLMEKEKGNLSFFSFPQGTQITIADKQIDLSKNSSIELPIGWYLIKVYCSGYNYKKIKVKLIANENKNVDLSLTPKTKKRAIIYSALLPGLGQNYQEKTIRSWGYGIAFFTSLGLGVNYMVKYNNSVKDYNSVRIKYEEAIDEDEINKYRNEMNALYDDINSNETLRNTFYITAGVIWLWNMIDVIYLPPGWERKVNVSGIMDNDKILFGINYKF